ncbi:MAG: amino acid adenylation domain-containing protein, partial [Cytophagales bacterium]|nr:amino acid adenylation domain-containing protein [Cytophagales bacterium]
MLTKDNIQDIYSLSPMQEGIFFHAQYDASPSTYFEQFSYKISGAIDTGIVRASIGEIVDRHDILRTVFVQKGTKRTYQVVLKERQLSLHYEDLSQMPDREEYLAQYRLKDRNTPFSLKEDMLMRVALFKVDGHTYEFVWSFHHILMDGWSAGILLSEFSSVYESLAENGTHDLPRPASYRQYIDWLENKDRLYAGRYWQKQLKGYDRKAFIPWGNGAKNSAGAYRKTSLTTALDENTTHLLNLLAAKHRVTVNSLVQVCWGILLARYNSTRDVVFGAVVSNRPVEMAGADRMVGLFINTIPVRVRFGAGETFCELLERVQQEAIASNDHQHYPLFEIYANTDLKPNAIDHILVFENYPIEKKLRREDGPGDRNSQPGYRISDVSIFEQTSYNFNVLITLGERLVCKADFNELAYQSADVATVFEHLQRIIRQVIEQDDISIDELTLLTGAEERTLRAATDQVAVQYPLAETIIGAFAEQLRQHPHRVALVSGDQALTYQVLDQQANRLAGLLRARGVGNQALIPLLFEPSFEMVIAILAVLKAGCAYLPIDPNLPAARIQFMLGDSDAGLLIAQGPLRPGITFGGQVVNLQAEELSAYPEAPPQPVSADALAYVIYTSGTTGVPKGVMIEHRNVVRLFFNEKRLFFFTGEDVWTLFHAYTFDVSVWEMYGSLLHGGRLVIIPRTMAREPAGYREVLRRERATILNQTPSAFYNLQEEDKKHPHDPLKLKCILFAGEELKAARLGHWAARYPACRLINLYGTTETTVHATYKVVEKADVENAGRSVGGPLPTLSLHVLDNGRRLMPRGVAGELYIGGAGLGRGYLNRPELTSQKFVRDPLHEAGRLYRTGDLGRVLPDGEIEYLGRRDGQVQLRGYRIELGEIESCLTKHVRVNDAVVLMKEDERGDQYLCAYLVMQGEADVKEMRDHLKGHLPDYMIPAYYVSLASIPMTGNGKVNKAGLPPPAAKGRADRSAPGNVAEGQLLEVWKEVLKLEELGVDESFFNLGGDSIKAIRILSGINAATGVKLRVSDLYSHDTV